MRIVRLANFVAPRSGGLRTALNELGAGYVAAGHTPELVIPGEQEHVDYTAHGRVFTIPGMTVPGSGGYRVLVGRNRVRGLLETLEPDRLEVSDRFTLRWTGDWAQAHGVRSMMVSHESLDGLLTMFGPGQRAARSVADGFNLATAQAYDTVLCTTEWAAAEFQRLGVSNLVRAPLGVDLHQFRPDRYDQRLREWLAPNGELLLVHCGRLSPEKQPEISLAALAELRRRKIPVVLVGPAARPSSPMASRSPTPSNASRRGRSPSGDSEHVSRPSDTAGQPLSRGGQLLPVK